MDDTEKFETIYFHLKLLAETIDSETYPFTKMIVENHLTRKEYEDLMQLIAKLHAEYIVQKARGYLDFSPLLVHFAGMLNIKLDPDAAIYALKQEGYYSSLMDEFVNVLKR
ncbi:hypothetical protein GCM10028778_14120 [Barrientosiimonas marina]